MNDAKALVCFRGYVVLRESDDRPVLVIEVVSAQGLVSLVVLEESP